MERVEIEYTQEQRARIVESLRAVAVAQAEFWDVLHEVEAEHDASIETDMYLIDGLAGDCNTPASFADLKDAGAVWDAFVEHSAVTR